MMKSDNQKSGSLSGTSQGTSFRLVLGILLFGLIMILPSGTSAWFDGLPWTGAVETLAVIVITPFLLILGYRFLSLRRPVIFLAMLLVLKIIMVIGAPSAGWLVKVYPNLTDEQLHFFTKGSIPHIGTTFGHSHHIDNTNDFLTGWIKTYATTWNNNASGILQEPWNEKLDFPLDWAVPLTEEIFDGLSPIFEIEGTLLLPEGSRFAIVAQGVAEGTLVATHEDGMSFVLSPAKSFEEVVEPQYQLPKNGDWRISGKLRYSGDDWSLIPVLVEADGTWVAPIWPSVSSIRRTIMNTGLYRDVLWQDKSVLSRSLGTIQFYKYLSWVIDIAFCLFFLTWGIWAGRLLVQKQILTLSLAVFSLLASCVPVVLAPVFAELLQIIYISDPTHASYLGISITAAGIGFLLWSRWKNDFSHFQADRIVPSVFLLFGPAMLVYFSYRGFSGLGQWLVWGNDEDWISYQMFARKIMVRGEWLSGGESALMGRELYPYVLAILNWLFGQSRFDQNMVDVWSVLASATILASLAIRLRLSPVTAFITSTTYLMINLIGTFRYHIGRGLSENTAMIFMMLAVWYMYRAREGSATNRIFLATIFGILGYWTRQDHLGVIVGLAFFVLEPVEAQTGGWKGYWERFKCYWRRIAWYWTGGVVFGLLLLCLRNWFLGAGFVLADTTISTIGNIHFLNPKGFYLILTGNEWPIFPSIAGFVVTIGTFVALMALVWRPRALKNFPLGLGLTVACLLVPYLFVGNGGYPPRFSIHLLPLALLSFMILLNYVFNGFKFPLKFQWNDLFRK